MPTEAVSYAQSWRQYRSSNWAAGLWLVLGLPATIFVAIGIKFLLGVENPLIALAPVVLAWSAAFFVLSRRVTRFRCPRCKGLYFAHAELVYGAGSQCSQCQLPLYAKQ